LLAALPDVAQEYKSRYGVKEFIKGLTGGTELKVEEIFSPTCTICGLTSGYQGAGPKTVQPARASAKVDFRLIPDQTPGEVLEKLRAHLDAKVSATCKSNSWAANRPPAPTRTIPLSTLW
jgi:acetylornithine deacetylase/succinyl-diaminopimelate desuccinylase-like protein